MVLELTTKHAWKDKRAEAGGEGQFFRPRCRPDRCRRGGMKRVGEGTDHKAVQGKFWPD